MTQPTPGPWVLGPPDRTACEIWVYPANDDAAPSVARVPVGDKMRDIKEQLATAHLIGAAPKLLDGCNALLGLVQLLLCRDDLPEEVYDILNTNHRIEEARAAIALAEPENEDMP